MKKINLIIIDSPDLTGKTWLVETLRSNIPNSICIKSSMKPKDNSIAEKNKIKRYYKEIFNFSQRKFFKDKTVIIDRFFPSQIVYSIKRGNDDFNDSWFKDFEKIILKTNHLFIMCKADAKTLRRRYVERGDDYIEKPELELLIKRYNNFYKRSKMKKTTINTMNKKKVRELISKIKGEKDGKYN